MKVSGRTILVMGVTAIVAFVVGGYSTGFFLKGYIRGIMNSADCQSVLWSYKTLMALECGHYQQAMDLQEKSLQSALMSLEIDGADTSKYPLVRSASEWLMQKHAASLRISNEGLENVTPSNEQMTVGRPD